MNADRQMDLFFIYNLIFTYFLVSQLGQSRTGTGTCYLGFLLSVNIHFRVTVPVN
jgi:hypothetical protein